jgi:beta-glucanase (GH16 family)
MDEGTDRVIRYSRGRILRRVLLAPALLTALTGCGIAGAMSPASSRPSSDVLELPSDHGAASAPGSAPGSAPASTGSGSQWKLAWQDEFTDSNDLSSNWIFRTSGTGFDQALNWFGKDSATVANGGGLVITAAKGGSQHTCWYGPCKYTSTEMTSRFTQQYGRFEARIKVPIGTGLWPAFWLEPQPQPGQKLPGEIDVLELNNKHPNEVTGYVHDGPVYDYKAEKVLSTPIGSQFHVYGVDWTSTGVTWTFDGQPYAHINKFVGWPLNQPFVIVLDLAVGGNWAGSPTASTVFPATMQVSWLRVYKMASLSPAYPRSALGVYPPKAVRQRLPRRSGFRLSWY